MTAVLPAARPGALALGRAAALLAVASAVVHLLHLSADSLGMLLVPAMALACLPCAWHLWRAPTAGVWRLTAAVDAGMLLVHATLAAEGSHHSAVPGSMWPGTVLVATQLVLAGGALLRR